ncbi:MAG: phosphatase PAP2 family protein, partial [Rhodothermales bacterium]
LVQAQPSQSRSRFLRWAYQDAVHLVQDAHGRTPLYLLGASAVLVPVSLLDTRIDHEVGSVDGTFGEFLDFTNVLGGPDMNLPVVALFAVSLTTNDTRFQDAAFTSLQSMVYAGMISYGVKYTLGRFRPEDHDGAYRFEPFSGRSSFPSGHTTTAFAVITPWVLYYPHPITYGLFALSTGTALTRIVREKHWATDVLAGGALGFMTAYWLTRKHQGEGRHVRITPMLGAGNVSLSLQVRL